jgi:hypothetical protein
VPEFTNFFHTLHTKLGIRDSKQHMVLNYHEGIHRYFPIEVEFFDRSSLGEAYRYVVKSKNKFKQKTR